MTCDAKSQEGDILKGKIVEEGAPMLRELLVKLLDQTKERKWHLLSLVWMILM